MCAYQGGQEMLVFRNNFVCVLNGWSIRSFVYCVFLNIGYPQHVSKKALVATQNKGVQPALDWLVWKVCIIFVNLESVWK